jgi:hypothetical protein
LPQKVIGESPDGHNPNAYHPPATQNNPVLSLTMASIMDVASKFIETEDEDVRNVLTDMNKETIPTIDDCRNYLTTCFGVENFPEGDFEIFVKEIYNVLHDTKATMKVKPIVKKASVKKTEPVENKKLSANTYALFTKCCSCAKKGQGDLELELLAEPDFDSKSKGIAHYERLKEVLEPFLGTKVSLKTLIETLPESEKQIFKIPSIFWGLISKDTRKDHEFFITA